MQGPDGRLQNTWQPPTLFTPHNVSVDSRIISEDTTIISIETPETSFSSDHELDNEFCKFSFHVAAVNPAGEGQCSQLLNQIIDCKSIFVTFQLIFRREIGNIRSAM